MDPRQVRVDNMSAIQVAKDPEHHGRIKHLDLRYYWLRDVVNDGKITISHCPTELMAADILTKALDKQKVEKCVSMLGLCRVA